MMNNIGKIIRLKTKEWRNYFRNVGILYRKIGRQSKGYLIISALMILVQAIQPFNSILFLRWIIEELIQEQRWGVAAAYAVIMCSLELLFRVLNTLYGNYEDKKIIEFKTAFLLEIEEMTMLLPISKLKIRALLINARKPWKCSTLAKRLSWISAIPLFVTNF